MQNVVNPFESPSLLSICAGMLGLERGLERAVGKCRTVAYVEIEAFVAWNLVRQIEEGLLAPALVHTNVKSFPFHIFRDRVRGFCAGYPCQPFSNVGKRSGAADPRHLYPFISSGISAARHLFCWFENVAAHLTLGFDEVYKDLRRLGYAVEVGIYSAAEVGASHLRERLFILAIKNEVLGDTQRTGLERYAGHGLASKGWNEQGGPTSASSIFPAPYGNYQHPWEPHRIEPRVGFVHNGYDFTADILRMAGNGVVEQVAEIAFKDLIRKHLRK